MSQAKHTPGPWVAIFPEHRQKHEGSDIAMYEVMTEKTRKQLREEGLDHYDRRHEDVANVSIVSNHFWRDMNDDEAKANARLIAAAPELLEVLHECIDAQWVIDSHAVEFDGTVHFGPYYDFSGLDGIDRHEFLAEHSCVVWPSGGKWSAYCTYEGSTWFESFDGADAAKETCMKLLDKVMPTHPAMKARAAIAKATGGE